MQTTLSYQEHVHWISTHILDEYDETRDGTLYNHQKMEIFLRCIADPGFQSGEGKEMRVTHSSVSNLLGTSVPLKKT